MQDEKVSTDADCSRTEQLGSKYQHRVPGQHVYQGLIFSKALTKDVLDDLHNFQLRPDDVIISGYPKSGSTWVGEIAWQVLHNGEVSTVPVYFRCIHMEDSRTYQRLQQMPSPRLIKTHLLFNMLPSQIFYKQCKVIQVMRNPKDIAVSYYHFYRCYTDLGKFTGSWQEFLDMFLDGYVCYGKWIDYASGWWRHRNDPNMLFLMYEDLIEDPKKGVLQIAEFCQKSLSSDVIDKIVGNTSFQNMLHNPATNFLDARHIDRSISCFLRQGQVGDWRNYFTSAQSDRCDKAIQHVLSDIGLTFMYENI